MKDKTGQISKRLSLSLIYAIRKDQGRQSEKMHQRHRRLHQASAVTKTHFELLAGKHKQIFANRDLTNG
ncbi:MAG TPA: hypothetical protein VFR58_17630 [Flavisolibacter sp.]|nr:hypothetical protein [Flavisolibacter sp.]